MASQQGILFAARVNQLKLYPHTHGRTRNHNEIALFLSDSATDVGKKMDCRRVRRQLAKASLQSVVKCIIARIRSPAPLTQQTDTYVVLFFRDNVSRHRNWAAPCPCVENHQTPASTRQRVIGSGRSRGRVCSVCVDRRSLSHGFAVFTLGECKRNHIGLK